MSPDRQPPEVLLADYEERCALLGDLGQVVEAVLKGLLHANQLRVHSVVHRVKAKSSAERKLSLKGDRYTDLGDMHDMLGVRIITFFPDEVDEVAAVVAREFEVDPKNSIDKRATLAPESFGYMSLHYVATLGPARAALTENARFAGSPFEIQIRSILQHAWAEIEHDLGYKTEGGIPPDSRRRFSRLAAALESSDVEFKGLRDELAEYRRTVGDAIAREPEVVDINRDSVLALTRGNGTVKRLDARLSDITGVAPTPVSPAAAEVFAQGLRAVGLRTVEEATVQLERHEDLIVAFAREWVTAGHNTRLYSGVSLLFLSNVIVAGSGSVDEVRRYAEALRLRTTDVEPDDVPDVILDTFRRASAT